MLESKAKSHRPISFLLVGTPILAFVLIAVGSVRQKSPTYDELIHLFAGYSYLKWGDFRTNPEHPPLAKALAALPLLALDLKDPRRSSPYWDLIPQQHDYGWIVAHRMIFLENDAETLFFYAKLPLLLLSAVLGFFVYRWARDLYGIPAGFVALFLYCLDPNILAHSPIIHTDVPFSAFFFIGSYFYWRCLESFNWKNLSLASISFGLVAITKFSFVSILPIWFLLGLLKVFSDKPLACSIGNRSEISTRPAKAVAVAVVLASACVTAFVVIWAAYGFRFGALAREGTEVFSFSRVLPEGKLARGLVSFGLGNQLFPESYVYGFLYVTRFMQRLAFLLGEVSESGFWTYFPVAFAVKTPLPTLILLAAAIGLWIHKRRLSSAGWFLLISAVAYFGFAVWSRMNIGHRHILPIYPFLFVLAGGAAAKLWSGGKRRARSGLVVLCLWYLWSAIHTYPHYLAYFNEIIGGPRNGFKVLTDSSLDWGQDLKGLKRWLDRNGVKRIQLAYFGTADPAYYGIDAYYLPGSVVFSPRPTSFNPEPPKYLAVSATYIYGVHSGKPLGGRYLFLRKKEPVATIGHSIFVYQIDEK